MKKRYKSAYKGYKGRRSWRVNLVPILAAAVLVLGAVAALYFGGVFSGLRDLIPHRQPAEQTDPERNTPPEDGQQTPDATPDPGQTTSPEQTPDPQTPESGYAVIEISGDKQAYDALYRVGNTGFEYFTYLPELGEKYAAAVKATASALKDTAMVYDLTIPLSSSITLPDALQGSDLFGDQKDAMAQIAGMMGENVRTVPIYDTLMEHRSEYIYFRTDHHWTALGAYYAYGQFCRAKGITPHELADYEQDEFPGFLGSFYRDSDHNKELAKTPDTVEAYHPVSRNAELDYTDESGKTQRWQVIFDVTDYPEDLKYSCFIGSDNPYTIIRNPDVTDNSSCVVVKESFGNAFVPYLVDHYQTVHVIDYRYWEGDLTSFVRQNGVQDVIFINNLSAIRSSYLMGKLQGIM